MSLTREQLETVRQQMEEEHRKDMEALERILSKFSVPSVDKSNHQRRFVVPQEVVRPVPPDTIRGAAISVLSTSSPDTIWTASSLYREMRAQQYPFTQDESGATNVLSAVLGKLLRSGQLELVSRGASRRPAQYRWKGAQNEEATEAAS
jgi:hypothetical protein